jgi:hypothetical protein
MAVDTDKQVLYVAGDLPVSPLRIGQLAVDSGVLKACTALGPPAVFTPLGAVPSFFPLLAPDGTAAAPSYSFASDPDNGLYRFGTNSVGMATAGTLRWRTTAGGTFAARGSGRFTGAYDSPSTDELGPGVELQYASGEAQVFGYNRTGLAFTPLTLTYATTFAVRNSAGTDQLLGDGTGLYFNRWRTDIWQVDSASDQRFYLGQPTMYFKSDGSTDGDNLFEFRNGADNSQFQLWSGGRGVLQGSSGTSPGWWMRNSSNTNIGFVGAFDNTVASGVGLFHSSIGWIWRAQGTAPYHVLDNVATATTATAGANTLPSNPVGFWRIILAGTEYKIPYYAA